MTRSVNIIFTNRIYKHFHYHLYVGTHKVYTMRDRYDGSGVLQKLHIDRLCHNDDYLCDCMKMIFLPKDI
jgi:hypothetical protein